MRSDCTGFDNFKPLKIDRVVVPCNWDVLSEITINENTVAKFAVIYEGKNK